MTTDEVIDLLSWIQGFDKRTVGKVDVATWSAVARELGWNDLTLARDGAARWYAHNTGWITPPQLDRAMRDLRKERRERLELEQRRSLPRPDRPTWARPVKALTARLGLLPKLPNRTARKPYDVQVDPVMPSVDCPWCGARAGYACTRPTGRDGLSRIPTKPHPSRHEAMAQANGLR